MFCCTLLYVHSSIAIILMGKRELVALLNVSSWCLVTVERLFLPVPWSCLRFVIVVFPDHTHLLYFILLKWIFVFLQDFIGLCSYVLCKNEQYKVINSLLTVVKTTQISTKKLVTISTISSNVTTNIAQPAKIKFLVISPSTY